MRLAVIPASHGAECRALIDSLVAMSNAETEIERKERPATIRQCCGGLSAGRREDMPSIYSLEAAKILPELVLSRIRMEMNAGFR